MERIENRLNQDKFQNVWHRLRVNLLHTTVWLKSEVTSFLDPFEITQPQFNILRILRGVHPNPLSTLQIRERMIDRMSDTSRMVDRLQKKGWVKKEDCVHDKRLVNVSITTDGLALLQQIDRKLPELDEITQTIDETDAVKLSELLDKLRNK